MPKPLISVIIPTRNRHQTLASCLRFVDRQHTTNFEVVVFNNSDPEEQHLTECVVQEARNPKIRLFRSERPLAMLDSWEAALASSQGEYIMVIGDDDTVCSHGLDILTLILEQNPNVPINWQPPWYYWPDVRDTQQANTFRFPAVAGSAEWVNSKAMIRQVCDFKVEFTHLPTIYTSCIPREVYVEAVKRFGRFFHTRSPDIGSGFLVAAMAPRYLRIPLPITIAGISGRSNGNSGHLKESGKHAQVNDFFSLNEVVARGVHAALPDLTANYAVEVANCALTIADLLKSHRCDHDFLQPNYVEMIKRSAMQINYLPETEREAQWFEILSWAGERKGLGSVAKVAVNSARVKGFPSGSNDRVSKAHNIGWVPSHSRFYGRTSPEEVRNVADFESFASCLFRYADIIATGSIPDCLNTRSNPNILRKGLSVLFKWMRTWWHR